MNNGIGNLGWGFILFSFGVLFGICWVHRTRHTSARGPYQGTQSPTTEQKTNELWQPEEEFEEVEEVVEVWEEEDEPEQEQETKPPACHPMALAMSRSQSLVPSHTLRLFQEN